MGAGKSPNGRGKKSGQEKSSHIARHHYQREFPTIATTFTTENLAEILSDVLKDILPHDLNRSEDEEGSSSASEVEPEPEPKKLKKNQRNAKKSQKPQKPEKKEDGRSHHVQLKCRIPGCVVKVFDTQRHLLTHVKRKELHADDVNPYAEIMPHGKQNTRSPPATLKKERKHQFAGRRNGDPCRSVTPSASAWISICRPSTT